MQLELDRILRIQRATFHLGICPLAHVVSFPVREWSFLRMARVPLPCRSLRFLSNVRCSMSSCVGDARMSAIVMRTVVMPPDNERRKVLVSTPIKKRA